MYLKFRYEYIEVEDVLESEVSGMLISIFFFDFKKYGKKSIE